jgi:uncharacterized protein YqhQ
VSTAGSEKVRLGGMALRNGIFVHSLDHWAAAVRTPAGNIRVASGRKPELPEALTGAPLLRGVVRIAEMLALLPVVRTALPDARLPFESPAAGGAMAASTLAAAAMRRSSRLPAWAAEALAAAVGVVPALVALRSTDLAGYHGAEHKAIGGYETGADAAEAAKEHERCGSHLVGPMLAATVAGNALVRRVPAGRRAPARVAAGLGAIGIAVETFGWMTRHRSHPLARALELPGYELQRALATREPSAEELEVARAALDEVLRREGRPPLPG